ncbi:MAG: hypothetical protein LBB94_01830 [Clostridiales bacterium]|jgi:hypothetical protein|nr:hypothetical protein [Clostridiales bacterium]
MAEESKHSGRRPDKPLAKPVRLFPSTEECTDETALIIDPEGPRRPQTRKLLSIISIGIVFVICVYLLRFPLSGLFSSKLYITLATGNTVKSLIREIMTFTSGNSVVKRGAALLREPNEQSLRLGTLGLLTNPVDLRLRNDSKRNHLMLELSRGPDISASFYLSDSTAGLRIDKNAYTSDPSEVGGDLNALLESNGLDIRAPLDLDLSYNACKRLIMGGSLGAVAPAYERLRSKGVELAWELLDAAKYKKSGGEKLEIGGKTVNCKAVAMRISAKDMREWLIKLADTIKADEDFSELFGKLQGDIEIAVRGQRFFHNGDINIKFLCYKDRIVSVRYSHVESQIYFESATLGGKYRLDNIYFTSSGVREVMFQAVGSHISPGEFRTNLYISGLGRLDELDKLQIVWDPSAKTDNVTLGKSGRVVARFTFAENEDGIHIDVPANRDNALTGSYALTEMASRPEWPDDTASIADVDLESLKALFK